MHTIYAGPTVSGCGCYIKCSCWSIFNYVRCNWDLVGRTRNLNQVSYRATDVTVELTSNCLILFPLSTSVIVTVYFVMIPFWSMRGGGLQENEELCVSTVTPWGTVEGAAWGCNIHLVYRHVLILVEPLYYHKCSMAAHMRQSDEYQI